MICANSSLQNVDRKIYRLARASFHVVQLFPLNLITWKTEMIEVLTVGIFIAACVMALLSPAWGLALVSVMFTLEQALQATSSIFLNQLSLANICVAAAVGIGSLRAISKQHRPFLGYFTFEWIVTIVIFTWSCVSLIWTPSFKSGSELISAGIPYFILYVIVSPFLIDGIDSLNNFFRVFLILGSAVIILILVNPTFTVTSGRLGINLGATLRTNPLAMGELGGSILLVAALFRIGAKSIFINIIRVVGFFCGTAIALQSGSRGQILFAVLLAFIFYPVSVRVKNLFSFLATSLGLIVLLPITLWVAQVVLGDVGLRRWDADVIAGGTEVRIANIMDLLGGFVTNPAAWLVGLGFNAFTSISTAGSEPYSHVMFIDIFAELGIPLFILFAISMYTTARNSIWLFRRFRDEPTQRATLAVLFSFFAYQILLMNKQGYLWAAGSFFFIVLILSRLKFRTEESDFELEIIDHDLNTTAENQETHLVKLS